MKSIYFIILAMMLMVCASAQTITGTYTVCVGGEETLSGSPAGGTWSSSTPAVATMYSTGVCRGLAAGTATVTYTTGSGSATVIVTVDQTVAPVTGSPEVCVGSTTSLACATPGGYWTSANPSMASVSVPTGVVTGVSAGTTFVSYRMPTTGCASFVLVTVNPAPAAITGPDVICLGSTGLEASTTTGGTWSSSDLGVATIGIGTGIVTSLAPGTTNISYTLGTGCYAARTMTVAVPPPFIGGSSTVCVGSTTTLTNGMPGGTWTSANIFIATVGSSSGVVTGASAGTVNITYAIPTTGCVSVRTVTVVTTPAVITGPDLICMGSGGAQSCATPGGTWSSSNVSIPIGSATGVVTATGPGTSNITYTLGPGCYSTRPITVNPLPNAITGTAVVCTGSSVSLGNSTPGGSWSSGTTPVAVIGSGDGIAWGIAAGTSNISYTVTATGCRTTRILTVTPGPTAISGSSAVCIGSAITLSCMTAGGTWSSGTTGIATVSPTTGIVTAITAGVVNITYTIAGGCFATKSVTVNALPGPITGPSIVCTGSVVTETCTPPGGAWSSSNVTVAMIAATGDMTGVASGTAIISYTDALTSCSSSKSVTVYPTPATIGGTVSTCVGNATTLTDATAGGTWSSSNPVIAAVNSAGIVTGLTDGVVTITYTGTTTCYTTQSVTVNPLPAAITGTLQICPGMTTTLNNATMGGIWSSGNLAIATIGTSTGIANGNSPGIGSITYTLPSTGCRKTQFLTVNPLPGAITGSAIVCEGQATTLASTSSGGVWTSGNISIATVAAGTGIVAGIAAGTAIVTFTLPATGCFVTRTVTVNPTPAPITGSSAVCAFSTTTLSSATLGGAWISSNPGTLSVGPSTGIVTATTVGTANITYTLSSGCYATRTMTVILGPSPITGPNEVCDGSTVSLGNIVTGGTWTTSDASIASITSGGIVTGNDPGTATINYTVSTGCFSSFSLTVYPTPAAITGTAAICEGSTGSLSCSLPGGAWSSSNSMIAPIDISGVVTGLAPGVVTIFYATPAGCASSTTLTVNPNPAAITGTGSVCVGSTTTLSSATGGGTWTSSSGSIATVGASTGIISAVAPGTTWITYTLGTGCITATEVTVYPTPAAITGPGSVCVGSTVTQSCTPPGGIFTSSNTAIASIDITTGVVTGLVSGVVTISYTLPTGCSSTRSFTVSTTPAAITGPSTMCDGSTITLSSTPAGGTWSWSSAMAMVAISGSGIVTAMAPGVATITYTLPSGCMSAKYVTVNPYVGALGGSASVCVGSVTALSSSWGAGTWVSSNPTIATVGLSTGVVTGIMPGTSPVTFVLAATGCATSTIITVNPVPPSITGPSTVCIGTPATVACAAIGGTWTSSDITVATIDATTGIVTAVAAGMSTITYTLSTGCTATKSLTVNALPGPIGGATSVCAGSATTLSSSSGPGTWTSSIPSIATVSPSSGILTGVSVGTSPITYVSTATGCATTTIVTVNPVPPSITGPSTVCIGTSATVACAATGGLWESSDLTIATIDVSTGIVTGLAAGTTTITYTLPTACYRTTMLTASVTPVVDVTATPSSCGPLYTAVATGATTYSWAPSTGITYGATTDTAFFYAGAPVTYTVTGTTAGCSATGTVTISANRILGHLSFGGPAPSGTSARVWLIQYDPADSSITAQDSLTTCLDGDAPYYEFTGKPAGSYLVKAKLLSSVAGTSDYFPTYGSSAPTWDLATPIAHTAASDSQHIDMLYGTVPTGPGFISGYVYMGAGKGTAADVPVANMVIYLRNTAGQVLTYTYTDASGAYYFSGIAPGSYVIYPEEMSYNTISYPLTLSAGLPADGIGFRKRTSTGIIEPWTLPNAVKPVAAATIAIYPNPANDMVLITNAKYMHVTITDMAGRDVYDVKITSDQQSINLASLPDGVYIIAAGSAQGTVQRIKLIKQ